MAGRRPLPSAPQHRAVLPRCLWPADRHIPRPTCVGGPCKKKGCASGLRDSGRAGSPCGLGGGPRRFVLPPRGAHGFRQNKALSCPSGKPVPVNTGVREGHAVKASPWGGVLVRCVACTPSWAVCAQGGLPTPWPCHWNVRHAGQTPSPRAPASTAAQSCPCPASASPPSTRFYSRRRGCPAAATRGHRPSAAGCPQSHVAAVASVCQRLLQHLGSHAVRGGLEPLPGRLPPAPGPDWAWGPCWLPALPAGGQAESAVLERRGHEPGPVGGEDLGQGQRTPGLLAQGPPEASLGAQGRGGEGEVLGLELELQAAGGQGVVCVARGLRGGQGSPENTGGLPRAESPHGREISPRRSLGAGRGDPS